MASVPRRRPRPSQAPAHRRHLRVIHGGRSDRRTRSPKASTKPKASTRPATRLVIAAGLVVSAFVFGLVVLHVLLAQSAFRLQTLQQQILEQEALVRQRLYEVASAESPVRIAEAATEIGLVVPQEQRYIVSPDTRAE